MVSAPLIAVAATLVAGCSNLVLSDHPWFEDAPNAPAIKPGLWASSPARTCHFDERRPLERWPDCASGGVIRQGEYLRLNGSRPKKGEPPGPVEKWIVTHFVLAPGDPVVVQLNGCLLSIRKDDVAAEADDAQMPPDNPSGSPATDGVPRGDGSFCYLALKPTTVDAAGQIAAFRLWQVVCGPPPSEREARRSLSQLTKTPFAGVRATGDNCEAASQGALRRAAAASERAGAVGELHWLRDGYR